MTGERCGDTTGDLIRSGYPCEATCSLLVGHHGPHQDRVADGRVYLSWYSPGYHLPTDDDNAPDGTLCATCGESIVHGEDDYQWLAESAGYVHAGCDA